MRARIRLDELETNALHAKGVELHIGRIIPAWEESPGPTRMPGMGALRGWDRTLLSRYHPFYLPFCDYCCLCTMGKCDLSTGKRGACGIDIYSQQSRVVLLSATIGAATHTGHCRDLIDHLVAAHGRDHTVSPGLRVNLEAPHIRLVTGIKPQRLGDLEDVVEYCEKELTGLLAACHTGQEGDTLDFESKVMHAGMVDHVAMEAADLAQMVTLRLPMGDPATPLIEIGTGCMDRTKPTILVIGHNVIPSVEIIEYLRENGLEDAIEVCGICCTALDMTRYSSKAKIVGPISHQTRFIRSGGADIIVIDEQCIRADILAEAQRVRAPVIATQPKDMQGLPDRSGAVAAETVRELAEGSLPGAVILDPERAAEVAVRTALLTFRTRHKYHILPGADEVASLAAQCTACGACTEACPNSLPLGEAFKAAAAGNSTPLVTLYESCIGCARCEGKGICPRDLRPHTLLLGACTHVMAEERFCVRSGRGPIQDTEIRAVGGPIVMGEIPGVIGIVGCPNYPGSFRDVGGIAEEFLRRRYIVTTSGCSAMSLGMYRTAEGKTLYEMYPGDFDAGGLVNVGSCVSNAHISGAAIKIASIFARRTLNSNYEEIADYVHNRVGAVGLAWGAMSQKASSIAAGFWRLGIPVIVGPHGAKYRRLLLGRNDLPDTWSLIDARTGEKVPGEPAPEHLFCAAETPEDAMVLVPKLCMRPSDTTRGRSMKLTHYIDLHRRFFGEMPDDVHIFVRTAADIPVTMRDEVTAHLAAHHWTERESPAPDPTLVPRLVRGAGGRS